MSFFDNIWDAAKKAGESKKSEISGYLNDVVTQVFVRAGQPAKGNEVLQQPASGPPAVTMPQATQAMKYAVPAIAAGLLLAVILRRK